MLALMGTSHLDLDGYDRLRKLLYHLKPSVIGIEETKEDFDVTSNLFITLSNPQIFYEKKILYLRFYLPYYCC